MSDVKPADKATKGLIGEVDTQAARGLVPRSAKIVEENAPKKMILIRFDPQLLERVDTAVKRRGISRSAWIQFTLSRALDQGEG